MKPVVSVSIMFAFFLTIRPCLTIIDALGPSDYCSDGNCLYEDDESYKSFVDTYGESSGDFHEEVSEKEVDEDELLFDDEDVSDGDKSTDDVAKRHDSFMDNFRKPLKYIWRATKKVANDAYNATVETLQDVGEILRTVLNEEAYNMFFSAAETLQANVATTDKLFGHTFSRLQATMLSVSIVLLAILLNYIFSSFISIWRLLLLDCLLFLVHGLFGPVAIANFVIDFVIYIYSFLTLVISFPLAFCITVVVLFLLSYVFGYVWPSIRRSYCPAFFRTDSDILYDLEKRSKYLEKTMKAIEARTSKMEHMLQVIHDKVVNDKKTQQDMSTNEA